MALAAHHFNPESSMRSSRSVSLVLGFSLLIVAALPMAALAQCGEPGVTGGGSVIQYVGDEGPAVSLNNLGLDRIVIQHFNQARWMAARWLAASRLAGARAPLPSTRVGRVR